MAWGAQRKLSWSRGKSSLLAAVGMGVTTTTVRDWSPSYARPPTSSNAAGDAVARVDAGREGHRVGLPTIRGPRTAALYSLLLGEPASRWERSDDSSSALDDDDLQMALYLCYELHYAGLTGVDDWLEWSPPVLMFRAALESEFAAALRELVTDEDADPDAVGEELQRMVRSDPAPSLSSYAETRADRRQLLEQVVHRSAYQLKEADPHSWAIPRLRGKPKAALVEIQYDEYGAGAADQMHSFLFGNTMRGLGLDARYGAYLDLLPGVTLATVNLISWFGLHRRLRGALVGHLAVFEMTSSVPNRRYANAFRRIGCGTDVTGFYDEHVEADAVHESIATWDLAAALAHAEPSLASDILFGARALLALEGRWASHLLSCWDREETSLLWPLVEPRPG